MKRLLIALVGMCVVGLFGASALAASAHGRAGRDPWASRIVTPSPNAVVDGTSVRVVVATRPGVRTFRAVVGGHDVTRFFVRADRGAERVGVLPRSARGVLFGRNMLHVITSNGHGRRWFATAPFVLARPVGGLVRSANADPGRGSGARLTVAVARPGLRLSVRVNGGPLQTIGGGRRRSATLTADSGLRPGSNAIRLRALDRAAGGFSERALTLAMPRQRPVAGAGRPKRTKTGTATTLDASSSVAMERGVRLRYRWTIVGRPRGSRARLRNATSVHPSLRPDRPGHYVLRVTVTPAGGARARASSLGASSATTTLSAAVAGPPAGVAIDTAAQQGGSPGIQIGSTFYGAPDATRSVQLLVLERDTLALVSNQSFGDDPTGASSLLTAVKALPSGDLVVLSKTTHDNGSNAGSAATINQALQAIGVSPIPVAVASTGAPCSASANQCSAFSAVGTPGVPAGQGAVNPGLGGLPAGTPNGALQGYLRENLTGSGYTFVDSERVPLDTGDPTANPAVVTIGSNEPGSEVAKRTYTSSKLSGPGFYVLVLDAGTLGLIQQATYANTASGLQGMSVLLTNVSTRDPTALVIVRSIGAVGRVGSGGGAQTWWTLVSQELQALGSSSYWLDALDGKTSSVYAQVGPVGSPGYPSASTQVATHEASGGGELTGLLARNGTSQFALQDPYPTGLKDPSRPLAGSLTGLMSLPPVAWPDRASPADQNALQCIADHVDPTGPLNLPIESNYANENLDWSAWATKVTASGYLQTLSPKYSDCTSGFTQSDFDTVATQLSVEWTDVDAVWKLIGNMQSPLLDTAGNVAGVNSVVDEINADVGTGSSPQTAHYNGKALAGDVFTLASDIATLVPGGEVVGVPFGLIGDGLTIAGDLDQGGDGSNAVATVSANGDDLAAALGQRYTAEINGFGNIGAILVSNWTYLELAGQNAQNTTNAVADWSWTPTQADQGARVLLDAGRRQAFETLFPMRYQLYRLQRGSNDSSASAASWTCETIKQKQGLSISYVVVSSTPFSQLPNFGNYTATVAPNGSTEYWVYAASTNWYGDGIQPDTKAVLPSPTVLNDLFGPQTAAGLSQPLFNPLQFDLEAYPSATSPGQPVAHTRQVATAPSTTATNNVCTPQQP